MRLAKVVSLDDNILFPKKNVSALGAGVGNTYALVSAKTEKRKVERKAISFMVFVTRSEDAAKTER